MADVVINDFTWTNGVTPRNAENFNKMMQNDKNLANAVNTVNNNLANNNLFNAKCYYKDAIISASGWTTLTIPISLGKTPDFVLVTPKTTIQGRFTWVVASLSSTAVVINIYNMESTAFSVGYYVLVY